MDAGWGTLIWLIDGAAREAMLFAAVGFVIGGIDDLAVDAIWLAHRARARFAPPPPLAALAPPAEPGRLAVFVAAWRESRVIGAMLRRALAVIDHAEYRIYVGTYPNDRATIDAVAAVAADDARVRLVVGARDGPTTKADNLNTLWHALARDDAAAGRRTRAVILHDAEDVIHADELALHDALLADHAVVQIPVLPLIDRAAPFVSAHYADEFAESHGAQLVVRAALGAGLPLAGVGCAIRVDALEAIAADHGAPFDATSLTEDYELGLRLGEKGLRVRFARVLGRDGTLVATRAYFPSTFPAAVAQKARWMTGIALAGWDRIGWGRALDWREHWMRMRDRRAPLAVLVLAAGWFAFLAWLVALAAHAVAGTPPPAIGGTMRLLLAINAGLMTWRIAMRVAMTGAAYGWREGVRAIPRLLVANVIALRAVGRAFVRYVGVLRGGVQRWDKTEHVFPDADDLAPVAVAVAVSVPLTVTVPGASPA